VPDHGGPLAAEDAPLGPGNSACRTSRGRVHLGLRGDPCPVQPPVAANRYGAGRVAGTAAAAGIPPPLDYYPDVEQVLARADQFLWEARAWNGHAG